MNVPQGLVTGCLLLSLWAGMAMPVKGEELFFGGEKISYTIKKFAITAGEATLTFEGKTLLDGRQVYLIVFRASGMNFYDEEKIYADINSFYPLRVERDLSIWGTKEKIVEKYDFPAGRVTIIKTAGGRTSQQVIEKANPIDNIYCFIYRYRRDGRWALGDTFKVPLPTQDVTIQLKDKRRITAGGKTFEACYMESNPRKYSLWFGQGEERMPLRIDGAVGFGNTSMMMTKYEKKK